MRVYNNQSVYYPPVLGVILCLVMLFYTTHVCATTSQLSDPELLKALDKAIAEASSFEDRFDAEVWLMDMSTRLSKKIPDHDKRIQLLKSIHNEATRAGLKPELVLAVIQVESNFDRWAISSVGARGLMQIMPFWLEELDRPNDNLFDINTNLRFGCTILRFYLDKEKGQLSRALGRYNGSLGSHRYPSKIFKALRDRWGER